MQFTDDKEERMNANNSSNRPSDEHGKSSTSDPVAGVQMSQRPGEPPMLAPWSNIKAKRAWRIQAAGPVHSLHFTPGGAHVVAIVQSSGASGQSCEIQVFASKTSQEVILEPQEDRPPSYKTLSDADRDEGSLGGNHHHHHHPGHASSAAHFLLHPGNGFEESIIRPDISGTRLNLVDLYYPKDIFKDPDDALITKLRNVQFPLAISPAPEILPGCDEVFAGVDSEEKGVLRVFIWSADEHLLRQRREWEFEDDEITHLEFTRDGRHIVCLTKKKYCRVVDLAKDQQQMIPIPTTHEPEMLRTHQSSDGKVRVAVSIWQDVVVLSHGYGTGKVEIYSLTGAVGRKVRALCLTKDCEYLAVATETGIDIFHPRTRKVVQTGLGRSLVDITKGCFSDDGRYLSMADAGGKIHLLKLSGPQWGVKKYT